MELQELNKRLAELNLSISYTSAVKDFIAAMGTDVRFGARPLKRAVVTYIEELITEGILEGEHSARQILHHRCSRGYSPRKSQRIVQPEMVLTTF